MKTRTEAIDKAYDALHEAYSKAFGNWWLNSTPQTSNWGFDITTYEGEEFIKTTDGHAELRVEQVKVIGRNSWKYIVFEVFPEDVGRDFEFYNPQDAANKFMELQLQIKLSA